MNIRRKRTQARRIASVLTTLLLPLVVGLAPAHATLITFFDFNDNNFVSDGGPVTSTITNNFNAADINASGAGTTVNADPDDGGPQPASTAGAALQVFNTDIGGNVSNQGRFIQFGVDTTGFSNIIVDFATEDPLADGFNNNSFQYSTDGTAFTAFGSYDPQDATYGLQTFDLSAISGINNNPNTAFRIVFNGGSTSNASARNEIDNLAVNSQVVPAPEPSTWAMMTIGLIGLAIASRRKKVELCRA